MRPDHEFKRRRDRTKAREWLAQHPDHLTRALRLAFALKVGQPIRLGQSGHLERLRPLDRENAFLAQGVAALLTGEGYVRPVQGQQQAGPQSGPPPGQYDRWGRMTLGPVTLSRPGVTALLKAGHPAQASQEYP